jgi:hypothetical protein
MIHIYHTLQCISCYLVKMLWCLVMLLCADICCAQIPAGYWYCGDLHAHSDYSGGDSSISAVINSAEDRGLDFLTITDHDTSLRGNPVHWDDPGYHSEKLVMLYGIEWTTPSGHANVWSAKPFSYTQLWAANRARDGVAAAAAARQQGALFSINHPASLFTSSWLYSVSPDVTSIEVWNTMYRFPSGNRRAEFCFWDNLLRSGRRIPCVGGSDMHQLYGWMSSLYSIGNPTTWIYASARTPEALLAGIRSGHISISYAPDAPRLDFKADVDQDGTDDVMMGDNVPETGREIFFTVRLTASRDTDSKPGYLCVCVYKNGDLFKAWIVTAGDCALWFSDSPSAGTYYRVELIGNPDATPVQHLLYGRVLALANPIYFGFQE